MVAYRFPQLRHAFASLGTLVLLAVGGCASLPVLPPQPPSSALEYSAATALGRLAISVAPDRELSGFRLMPGGEFAFHARLELARRAERTLDVQYYQIEDDETGRYVLRMLRDAALRGVRVRLLIDDLYTSGEDELLLGLAATPNVELRLFNPFAAGRASLSSRLLTSLLDIRRVNRRMHNKLFIADGAMAVAGGRNIGNQYFTRTADENFIDLDTFVVGALVRRLGVLFDMYWNSEYVRPVAAVASTTASSAALQARFDELTGPSSTPAPQAPPPNDVLGYGPIGEELTLGTLGLIWTTAEAYADDPGRVVGKKASYGGVPLLDVESVRYNVREQIRRARSNVTLVSPYMVPGRGGLEVIREIRARNVQVDIVTNSLSSTDEPLVHVAYRRYRPALLRAGVNLWELSSARTKSNVRLGLLGSRVGRLHSKAAVMDNHVLFLGSMNFDPRSEIHNTEIGLIIYNAEISGQVLKLIDLLKQQGSYRVLMAAGSDNVRWVVGEGANELSIDAEPDTGFWGRCLLNLVGSWVPEGLL